MAHALATTASSSSHALGRPSDLIERSPTTPRLLACSRIVSRRFTTATVEGVKKNLGANRRNRNIATAASSAEDDDAPELPDYDVTTLGPLESSAIALGVSGWKGGSDDANSYVLAIDRGYVLIGAQSPSELALMKDYQKYWAVSEAATLPGVRAPIVYSTVEVGGDVSVIDALQAHSIAAGGAEPDVFCFKLAPAAADVGSSPSSSQKAIADGVKAAWEMGACPGTVAVEDYDAESLEALVSALSDVPQIKVAFNRVAFSLARREPLEDGTMDACQRLGVGVVATAPLGEGSRVTNETHPDHDPGLFKLLGFMGSIVGGGVQRSPLQVGLNYVMCKGAVPELATRQGAAVWECGGAMLWRLDENAVAILDERAAATAGRAAAEAGE